MKYLITMTDIDGYWNSLDPMRQRGA